MSWVAGRCGCRQGCVHQLRVPTTSTPRNVSGQPGSAQCWHGPTAGAKPRPPRPAALPSTDDCTPSAQTFPHASPPHLAASSCRVLTGNDLTGTVPASWTQLRSLRDVVVSPGNLGLCTAAPRGGQFTLCSSTDTLCLTPLPPDDDVCPDDLVGGSFPIAAVVVPVAVVGGAALAAAGFILWRRRRRRAAADRAAGDKAAEAADAGPSLPAPVKCWPGQASAGLCKHRSTAALQPHPPVMPSALWLTPPRHRTRTLSPVSLHVALHAAGHPTARVHRPSWQGPLWQHDHSGWVGRRAGGSCIHAVGGRSAGDLDALAEPAFRGWEAAPHTRRGGLRDSARAFHRTCSCCCLRGVWSTGFVGKTVGRASCGQAG